MYLIKKLICFYNKTKKIIMKKFLIIVVIILTCSSSSYSQEKEDNYSISLLGGPRWFTGNGKYRPLGDYSNTRGSSGIILLSDTYKKHFKFGISLGIYTKNFRRKNYRSNEMYADFESKYFAMQLFYTILYINNNRFRIGNGMSVTNSRLLRMTTDVCYTEYNGRVRTTHIHYDVTHDIVSYNFVWSFKLLLDCAYYIDKHICIVVMPYIEHIFNQVLYGTHDTRYEEQQIGSCYPQSKKYGGMWFYGVDLGIEYRF